MHNPPDLATTMSLSRLHERKEQFVCLQSLDVCISKTTNFSPRQHARFVKKLTGLEMEESDLRDVVSIMMNYSPEVINARNYF